MFLVAFEQVKTEKILPLFDSVENALILLYFMIAHSLITFLNLIYGFITRKQKRFYEYFNAFSIVDFVWMVPCSIMLYYYYVDLHENVTPDMDRGTKAMEMFRVTEIDTDYPYLRI